MGGGSWCGAGCWLRSCWRRASRRAADRPGAPASDRSARGAAPPTPAAARSTRPRRGPAPSSARAPPPTPSGGRLGSRHGRAGRCPEASLRRRARRAWAATVARAGRRAQGPRPRRRTRRRPRLRTRPRLIPAAGRQVVRSLHGHRSEGGRAPRGRAGGAPQRTAPAQRGADFLGAARPQDHRRPFAAVRPVAGGPGSRRSLAPLRQRDRTGGGRDPPRNPALKMEAPRSARDFSSLGPALRLLGLALLFAAAQSARGIWIALSGIFRGGEAVLLPGVAEAICGLAVVAGGGFFLAPAPPKRPGAWGGGAGAPPPPPLRPPSPPRSTHPSNPRRPRP